MIDDLLEAKLYDTHDFDFITSNDTTITLLKPLDKIELREILESFDDHHWAHSGHWWSNTTKDDYPSKHPEKYKNGIALNGTDFNDGSYKTYLFISSDAKKIQFRYYTGAIKLYTALAKFGIKGEVNGKDLQESAKKIIEQSQ